MLISNLPVYNAPNYAPLKPLLELRHTPQSAPSDLTTQIKSLYQDLKKREESVIFAAAETAYTISSFIQGKQFWQQNWARGGQWTLVPDTRTRNPNNVTSINITQFQISQMLEDLISSNPDFEPADMFQSFKHADEVRAAKAVWNSYERKFYTPVFNIQQGLQLLTTGTAIEEVVYDSSLKAFQIFKEIWGEAEIETEAGGGECYECGTKAHEDDFHRWESPGAEEESQEMAQGGQSTAMSGLAQCPNCGSFETDVRARQTEKVPTLAGYEKYDIGDFRLNDIPLQSTRFDVSKTPETSGYFIDLQYIPLNKLKRLIGDIQIEGAMEDDAGLDYLYKVSRIGAGIGGAKRELGMDRRSVENNAMLIRMSIDADLCAEIDIPHTSDETMTLSGEIEGRTLADICPGGCTIMGFNGMQTIYGIYPKHHSRKISSCVYFSKPQSGMGRGAEDLMEIQKRSNRLDAQQAKAVDGASPGYAFLAGAIDENDLKKMGFPNAKLPITQTAFNQAKGDIGKIVKQFEAQKVAPQLFEYANKLEKLAQLTAHNVSMSGAVFNADVKTATGQNILEATAQAITIPFLQSKSGMRNGTVHNLLFQYKEIFHSVRREFTLGANQNKQVDTAEISGADINPEIEFVIVANSFIPQNHYVRKVDLMNFTEMLGGAVIIDQLIKTNPRLLNVYEKGFNLDLGLNNFTQLERVCRQRLKQALELLELYSEFAAQGMQSPTPEPTNQLTQTPENDTMSSTPPPEAQLQIIDQILGEIHPSIVPKEKNHLGKSDWFADYLDTEDALKMRDDERRIVIELSIRHDLMQQIAQAGLMAMGEGVMQMAMLPNQAIQAKLQLMAQQANMEQEQEFAPDEKSGSPKKAKG